VSTVLDDEQPVSAGDRGDPVHLRGHPADVVTMIALVRSVTLSSTRAGSMLNVTGWQSTKRGLAR